MLCECEKKVFEETKEHLLDVINDYLKDVWPAVEVSDNGLI